MYHTLPMTMKIAPTNFAHVGSLSTTLEMALEIGPIIAIFSENKPPR
jgi:hypothetical protein